MAERSNSFLGCGSPTSVTAKARARGKDAVLDKNYELAIQCFSEGIDLDSSDHTLFALRSPCHSSVGDYGSALQDGEEVARLRPDLAEGYDLTGLAQFKLGRYDEAAQTYKIGLERLPNNPTLKEGMRRVMEAASRDLADALQSVGGVRRIRRTKSAPGALGSCDPCQLLAEHCPDVDSSTVQLSTQTLVELKIHSGDHVLLRGRMFRQTVGIASENRGLQEGRAQVNGVMLKNLRLHHGDTITVFRLDGLISGRSVRVAASALPGTPRDSDARKRTAQEHLASYFNEEDRPLCQGDTFMVRCGAKSVEFRVVGVYPGSACVVAKDTEIECVEDGEEPVEKKRVPQNFSASVKVTARTLTGETLYGPAVILRTTMADYIKSEIHDAAWKWVIAGHPASRHRTFVASGCGIKLMHKGGAIGDRQTFQDSCFGSVVELTVVLFVQTYSVVVWGDVETGGTLGGDRSETYRNTRSGVTTIFGNGRAFAALKDNGAVVAWGDPACGGIMGRAALRLEGDAIKVYCNGWSFAALKNGGVLVTWGDPGSGGDSSAVAKQISRGVSRVFSNDGAFAALKESGALLAWGDPAHGGDTSAVASRLQKGVTEEVRCSSSAFAAVKITGAVVTWGDPEAGGDSSSVAEALSSGVLSVRGSRAAFAAVKDSGCVVAWGDPEYGGDTSIVADQISSGVLSVHANEHAFAALKASGSVVTWGDTRAGGDSSAVASQLTSGVASIISNEWAFAALTRTGAVVAWGDPAHGGDASAAAGRLGGGVVTVVCNKWAFAAIKDNGAVVTWGAADGGGDSSRAADQLEGDVVEVHSSGRAFAALKAGGAVVAWGDSVCGGDTEAVEDLLQDGVVEVCANDGAFAARKSNGSIVTWGNRFHGGVSHDVADLLADKIGQIHGNGQCFAALKEAGRYVT